MITAARHAQGKTRTAAGDHHAAALRESLPARWGPARRVTDDSTHRRQNARRGRGAGGERRRSMSVDVFLAKGDTAYVTEGTSAELVVWPAAGGAPGTGDEYALEVKNEAGTVLARFRLSEITGYKVD